MSRDIFNWLHTPKAAPKKSGADTHHLSEVLGGPERMDTTELHDDPL